MCLNKKVIGGLAVAALAIFLVAPDAIGLALLLLIIAVCPLSMLVMMRSMSGSRATSCASAGRSRGVEDEAEIARLHAEVQQLRAERTPWAGSAALDSTADHPEQVADQSPSMTSMPGGQAPRRPGRACLDNCEIAGRGGATPV